jgi:2-keto-4-pentenoate hydratase/2-oxohepta-3-ene-1,7-dioic acid hydratase in catechol pathway
MGKDLDRPMWRGQRPWFEIWFAVVVDESRRRALWVRQTMFVPRIGDARATVWGAWFDADANPPSWAAKRFARLDTATLDDDGEHLVRTFDSRLSKTAAVGAVETLAWDVSWRGGREAHPEVPVWLPAATHARAIVHDADAAGTVIADGRRIDLRGKAFAMHLWGKRRVPTQHWIYAPFLGDGSLEVTAVSLRDSFSLGLSTLRLDGPAPLRGTPATSAHPTHLVTSTVAGPRRLIHTRAWAEPATTVGYVYRDTDDRDLMVAQSAIGSAHFEVYTRAAPGAPWRPVDERRAVGGVAIEIHQHTPLPGVEYIPWDATARAPRELPSPAPRPDTVPWPEVTAIVALGLTYGDHVRETGQKLDASTPPTSVTKHVRPFAPGGGGVRVPDSDELFVALDAVEPGVAAQLRKQLARVPAVMDYEGELALVALADIDDAALAAGAPQPLGVAAANDLTARLVQALGESTERPLAFWTAAKSFRHFLPVAERVWAPAGGLAAMPELTLETRVNGERRQHASTKLLIYDLPAIVRAAKAHLGRPLARGDVILTGTPAGVGLRLSPLKRRVAGMIKDRFRKVELLVSSYATSTALLRPGDVVEIDAGIAGRVRTRLVI